MKLTFEHAETFLNECQHFLRIVLFCLQQVYNPTGYQSVSVICLSFLQYQTTLQHRSVECAVLGWLRRRQLQDESPAQVHSTVSEDDLPFPMAILDNTHLRGQSLKLDNDDAKGLPAYA